MTARYRIERGQLSAQDEEGKRALSGRSGDYLLAPTIPDLLVLFRAEPSGEPGPSPRVVLSGDASGFPLADLIAYLGQARFTGALRVHAPSGQRAIMLKEGDVHGATSDNPADRLGEVIVRLGYATQAQVEKTLRDHPPSRIGRALVEQGIVQAHDVWKCITHQVSEIFHAIILCREGTFFVLDQVPQEASQLKVQLSMQSLLMDAIRKVDELAHFRKRIPHGRLYVSAKRGSDGKLEAEEQQVLALCDGKHTILELGSMARMGEFDATRVVYRLLEGGYVQLSERPVGGGAMSAESRSSSTADLSPREPRTVVRIYNQIFAEIREQVAAHSMERELVAAANAALSGRALSASPVLEGILFDANGALPEDKLIARYEKVKAELGPEPVPALRQALSDVMFFLLFQAGELLEQQQDEQLARRVKELLAPLDEA